MLPALMAVALFAVTGAWNEFLFAFVFIQSNSATTLPVGLGRMDRRRRLRLGADHGRRR